jgi:hypothetical protein
VSVLNNTHTGKSQREIFQEVEDNLTKGITPAEPKKHMILKNWTILAHMLRLRSEEPVKS